MQFVLTCFWSFVNICGILLTEIVSTFKIRFEIKFTRESDMTTSLAILRIVYLPSSSIMSMTFETSICLLQSHVGQILLHLWRTMCHWEISLFTYEVSLKTPYKKTKELPQFSKTLHYLMTELFVNFYISSSFHYYSQSISQTFLQQWSTTDSYEITISLKLSGA